MTDNLWMLLAALALSVVFGVWWRSRQGEVSNPHRRGTPWADLDLPIDRVVLLQFSAEVCSACRQTARVLTEVVEQNDDIAHVEIDVADHRDLAAALGILRTPTVIVIGTDGLEAARTSGAMNPRQAREAIARARADHPNATPSVPMSVPDSAPARTQGEQ